MLYICILSNKFDLKQTIRVLHILFTVMPTAECHYNECRYAESYLQNIYAECHYAECLYVECRYAECHSTLGKMLINFLRP